MSSATLAAAVPRTHALDRRGLSALALGHLGVDLCQGAVPALLPFLIHDRGINYAQAGALVLVMTGSSAVMQLLFGHLTDRSRLPWLGPAALVAAASGIALGALSDSYGTMVIFIALSGTGVGAYHPEAARRASHASGHRRATGMSFFSVGGNMGYALAPAIIGPLALTLGVGGAALIAAIPAMGALMLATTVPRLVSLERDAAVGARHGAHGVNRWRPFAGVSAIAGLRSGLYFGLQTFLPAFLIAKHNFSAGEGDIALTVMLAAGAAGTLLGGRLADRIGRRPLVIASMAVLCPLTLLLAFSGSSTMLPLAGLIGFFCVGTFPITLVLGQELLPRRVGLSSAITIGAALGAGGLIAAALGPVADSAGLGTVIVIVALLPLPALALSLALPRTWPGRQPPQDRR